MNPLIEALQQHLRQRGYQVREYGPHGINRTRKARGWPYEPVLALRDRRGHSFYLIAEGRTVKIGRWTSTQTIHNLADPDSLNQIEARIQTLMSE